MRVLHVVFPLAVSVLWIAGCNNTASTVGCSSIGSTGLFVAPFDADTPGSQPSTAVSFGPPGASLSLTGPPGSIEVINSGPMSSLAVKIKRVNPTSPSTPEAVPLVEVTRGEFGPPATVFDVRYNVYAEESPANVAAAGMTTTITDASGRIGAGLSFNGGEYEVWYQGGSEVFTSTFPVNSVHQVHFKFDLSSSTFTVCIDGNVMAVNKTIIDAAFDDVHGARFSLAAFIFEAFPASYVLDEIRIHK